jgi:hypothetical protein
MDARPPYRSLPPNTMKRNPWKAASLLRAAPLCAFIPIMLAGCGSGTPPKIAEQPDVIVTLDGKRHACLVALAKEPQGSTVPCKEAVAFVKDELRVPSGSIYDIRVIETVDNAQIASVRDALNDAGYRFIGGRKLP